MSTGSLLCIGRATVDLVSLVERFPPADGKITALSSGVFAGGPALNAAVTATALSHDATLISSVGTTGLWPDVIRADLIKAGVSLFDLASGQAYAPPVSQIISTRSTGARSVINQPTPQQDKTAASDLPDFATELSRAGAILFDQFEPSFVSTHAQMLKESAATKVLDAGSFKPQTEMFLTLCDIPIVSARFCNDIDVKPRDLGRYLRAFDIDTWAVTLGADGVIFADGQHHGHIPATPVDAIDTLGAGDIFHGAFCAGLLRNLGFIDSLKLAGSIATTSCQYFGTREWINHIND